MRCLGFAMPVVAGMFVLAMLHGSADAGQRRTAPQPNAADAVPITFSGACTNGNRILVAAVGDLLFHESLQRQALTPSSNYRRFFSDIEGILKNADIAYGNLEGPAAQAVAAGGGNVRDPGRVMDRRVYGTTPGALIFNYHPSAVTDIKAVGFSVLSTANNHAADRGALGIDRTIDALEAAGIAYSGTRRRTGLPGALAGSWTTVTEAKGMRVAWLACTYGTNGMPDRHNQILQCYRDRDAVMAEITKAAADPTVDAVILTPHWGLEGSATPLKTDRAYARAAVEAGASAVIGAHPHVLQPWERIETADGRDGLVVYSTGNFVSNQTSPAQRSGVIALLELVKPAVGARARVSAAGFVPTWVEKQGSSGHRVVEQTGAGHEMAAALKATLKLLPAGNRVASKDMRNLPRNCPPASPQEAPAEPMIVASVVLETPELRLPTEAPEIAIAATRVIAVPATLPPSPPPPVTTRLPHLPTFVGAGGVTLASYLPRPLPDRQPLRPARPGERVVRARSATERRDLRDPADPFRDADKTGSPTAAPKRRARRARKPGPKAAKSAGAPAKKPAAKPPARRQPAKKPRKASAKKAGGVTTAK